MNRLLTEKRAKIIQLLCEGNSLRSTSRIADCSLTTVTKLLIETGTKCQTYQDKVFQNLNCKRIQIDEIWSFVYAKKECVTPEMGENVGDIWTYTSICSDTKLVPCWLVGPRNAKTTREFIKQLATKFHHRIELTSDGYAAYKDAVDENFHKHGVDFGLMVKCYAPPKGKRYGHLDGIIKQKHSGEPDMDNLSTSYVERMNLTIRTSNKRFARKTNAFSKKFDNHCHAMALMFMHYNFVRIHKSLRVTPAMAAEVTDRLWSFEDVASL